MTPFLRHLLISSAFLAFSYLIYQLVFRKERNFRQRRIYLLAVFILSITLPLSDIHIKISAQLPQVSQKIPVSPVFVKPEKQIQGYPSPSISRVDQAEVMPDKKPFNWQKVIFWGYIFIALFLLLRMFYQICRLCFLVSKSKIIKGNGYRMVLNQRYRSPFSFFGWIFIPSAIPHDEKLDKVILHEMVHVRQKHSVDNLLFELACAVLWFNPFVWLMRHSLQLVHEYLADEGALSSGIQKFDYQALLVNQVAEADLVCFTSHFSKSTLKSRILMMINESKFRKTKYRILAVFPLFIILLVVIACINGSNPYNVKTKEMVEDRVIRSTFNRGEIRDLAQLRVMTDQMIQRRTGSTNMREAWNLYVKELAAVKTAGKIADQIDLPHDSLVDVISENKTFREIWNVNKTSVHSGFSLNRDGKIMAFIQHLSEVNSHYSTVLEGIEIAGDISPVSFGDFITNNELYHLENEAERLYATVLLIMLNNPPYLRSDQYHDAALQLIKENRFDSALVFLDKALAMDAEKQVVRQLGTMSKKDHFDTFFGHSGASAISVKTDTLAVEVIRKALLTWQKNPSGENALSLYRLLPEKRITHASQTESELFAQIGDALQGLEKQVFAGDRNSVKLAFRLFAISDGAFTEWLQIMLGNTIRNHPRLFLEELKVHQHLCHELPVVNFGPEFVDKLREPIAETNARIQALQRVSNGDLAEIGKQCINRLQEKRNRLTAQLASAVIIVKDSSDYSDIFLKEFNAHSSNYQNIILDSNKIFLNGDLMQKRDYVEYFPEYIMLNREYVMTGEKNGLTIDLHFTRFNQTTIRYHYFIKPVKDVKTVHKEGEAHLWPVFYYGTEMDRDDNTGESYDSQQFIDRNEWCSIRIGRGENGGLRAKIVTELLSLADSPVLRTGNVP